MKKFLIPFILVFSFLANIRAQEAPDNFELSKNLEILTNVYRELNANYVDDVQPGELMKTGIDAMLSSLDPYTVYIPESQIEDYKFMTTGQYGGIGALIHTKGDYVYVSEPYEGFAAAKAGLKAGDKILKVNGEDAKGKSSDDLSKLMKGQPGTQITLLVERINSDEPIEFQLNRETIKVQNVSYSGMLNADIGYIKLDRFTQKAFLEVKNALLNMKKENDLKGLVFDLRGNGGGLMNEAIDILSLFVPKGTMVVETKGKLKSRNHKYYTSNEPVDLQLPIVFIVDGNSASASEILAGSMQDLDRAVVLGQRTFGKGLVQNVVPLNYNAQMKVTIAKYYIPSGRCVQAIDYTHHDGQSGGNKIPDSLTSEFETQGGRKVFDGRGILPDIVIEPVKYSNITSSIYGNYHVFDFATNYFYQHDAIDEPLKFQLDDKTYDDFLNYLSDKDYDYKTRSELVLEKLKSALKDEEYFALVEKELDSLDRCIAMHKQNDLLRHADEVKELLRLEIISRYYAQNGRIEASLAADPEVMEAEKILSDYAAYKSYLAVNKDVETIENN